MGIIYGEIEWKIYEMGLFGNYIWENLVPFSTQQQNIGTIPHFWGKTASKMGLSTTSNNVPRET